jgi:hypothetical protein
VEFPAGLNELTSVRTRTELNAAQARYLETILELGYGRIGIGDGLFDDLSQLARFMGRAPVGPSDTTIDLEGRLVPLWWATSAVGSGHANLDAVLDAWRKLPAEAALAAYAEIASGKAYDVLEAHLVTDRPSIAYSCDRYGEAHQKLYRERVVTLLADVSLAFGAAGEAAARALVAALPGPQTDSPLRLVINGEHMPLALGAAQAFVALLSGVRHASARKGVVDDFFDGCIPHLCVRISTSKFVAPKLVQAIAKGLPKPRAEAFKKAAACTAR